MGRQSSSSKKVAIQNFAIAFVVFVSSTQIFVGCDTSVLRFDYYGVHKTEAQLQTQFKRFERDAFEVEPGIVLQGLVQPPKNRAEPWILFFGGNSDRLFQEAESFRTLFDETDIGFGVWAPRGFEGSTGTPTPENVRSDAQLVYQHFQKTYGVLPRQIHLVGFSLGTYPVLALLDATKPDGWPRSATLLAPFTQIDIVARRLWGVPITLHRYDNLAFLQARKPSIAVVHGQDDRAFPVAHGVEVARAAGVNLLRLPNTAHLELLEHLAVKELLAELLGNGRHNFR